MTEFTISNRQPRNKQSCGDNESEERKSCIISGNYRFFESVIWTQHEQFSFYSII